MTNQLTVPAADAPALRTSPREQAIALLRGLSHKRIDEVAKQLFPGNKYQRFVFHAYVHTVRNCENPTINPNSYPVNIEGDGGYGKSALYYEFGPRMAAWLTEQVGAPVKFRVVTQTLAGLNDFSEVLGVVAVDRFGIERAFRAIGRLVRRSQKSFSKALALIGIHPTDLADAFDDGGPEFSMVTRIAPAETFPVEGDDTLGIINLDDYNRAIEPVTGGAMEYINRRNYNGRKLPLGWAIMLASNQSGGGHKVRFLDAPQRTRTINVPYEPDREIFRKTLNDQGVCDEAIVFFEKYPEMVPLPGKVDIPKEMRPVNWRNATMVAHLLPSIRYDEAVYRMVMNATFGPGAANALEAVLSGDHPLSPRDIVGGNASDRKLDPELDSPASAKRQMLGMLKKFKEDQRTDLIAVSGHRLAAFLQLPHTILSEEQIDNVGEFFLAVPRAVALDCLSRLVAANAPKADHWMNVFHSWRSTNGGVGALGELLVETNARAMELLNRELAA